MSGNCLWRILEIVPLGQSSLTTLSAHPKMVAGPWESSGRVSITLRCPHTRLGRALLHHSLAPPHPSPTWNLRGPGFTHKALLLRPGLCPLGLKHVWSLCINAFWDLPFLCATTFLSYQKWVLPLFPLKRKISYVTSASDTTLFSHCLRWKEQ